jgi:cytoskeleton-associated protein 5
VGVRVRGADTTMGGDDEATQLAEAARLPWEERFKHSFWKARVAAYECVGKEAATAEDVPSSNCLRAFGALLG